MAGALWPKKMKNNIPRPWQALHALTRDYPRMGRILDDFLSNREGLPDWPPYVLMPMGGWYAIASSHLAGGQLLGVDQASEVSRLAAIGAWRYSQGIYRIAPELLQALLDSPLEGTIPTDVLHCLPEWCLYIETPGMIWHGEALYGFWVHLEHDANDGHEELRLFLDAEGGFQAYPLHLGGDLGAAIEGFLTEARRHGAISAQTESDVRGDAEGLSRLLSLILYLCTDAPEIDDTRRPGSRPDHPRPKRVKSGWRLFPAQSPRIWTVGQELAAWLREPTQVSNSCPEGTGRTVRAHLRRAHWHGYWTGPRKGDSPQKFVLRWIHPLIAGGHRDKEAVDGDR